MAAKNNISILNGEFKCLETHTLKKASFILKTINHDLRRKIINILNEKQKITVTDLFLELRLEQSIVSQHLAMLRRAKVVDTTRNGKFIYYSLNQGRLKEINHILDQLIA